VQRRRSQETARPFVGSRSFRERRFVSWRSTLHLQEFLRTASAGSFYGLHLGAHQNCFALSHGQTAVQHIIRKCDGAPHKRPQVTTLDNVILLRNAVAPPSNSSVSHLHGACSHFPRFVCVRRCSRGRGVFAAGKALGLAVRAERQGKTRPTDLVGEFLFGSWMTTIYVLPLAKLPCVPASEFVDPLKMPSTTLTLSATMVPHLASAGVREAVATGTLPFYVDRGSGRTAFRPPKLFTLARTFGMKFCLAVERQTMEARSMEAFFRVAGDALAAGRVVLAARRDDTEPADTAGHLTLRTVPRGCKDLCARSRDGDVTVGLIRVQDAVRFSILREIHCDEAKRRGAFEARVVKRDFDTQSMLDRRESLIVKVALREVIAQGVSRGGVRTGSPRPVSSAADPPAS